MLFGTFVSFPMITAEALVVSRYFKYLILLRKVISPSFAFSMSFIPVILKSLSPIIFALNISLRSLILKSIYFILI